MRISVVIPTMNRPKDVKAALDSLTRQTFPPHEIILVDQSTNNQTKLVVMEARLAHPDRAEAFKYLVQEEKSLVKARNRGLDAASGDLVCFMDDDAVFFDDFFEKAVPYFEKDPALGALSGNTIVPNKPAGFKWMLRKTLMRIFLISFFDGKMTPSGFGYPIYEREIDAAREVEFLPGCDMIFRRSVIGPERFDEWFTGYSFREDCDFSYRIARLSKAIMVPDAKLYHNYSTSNRLDAGTLKKMEIRNYQRVFEKHKGGSPMARLLFGYSVAGLVVIDLIEFLLSWKAAKFMKFRAALGSTFRLFTGRPS
jgi:GT2 family glycosyltransferase